MRLIINGQDIELPIGVTIAQTKQVNDLVNLSSRQSNYTNTFTAPKSAKNIKVMNYLGIVGNTSNVPYQRNEAYLYDDEGLCFVNKGWAIITETNNGYKINVYDGIIDFYKAIENKNLSELDLTEINHVKNLTTIIGSWDVESPYRYIIADYNGKAVVDGNTNHINADYLVPSVNVKWLFNKVHEFFGFNYIGQFLTSFNFENLWMTFPKGISDAELEEDILYTDSTQGDADVAGLFEYQRYFNIENFPPVFNLLSMINNRHFQVNEDGTYKVNINGGIRITGNFYTFEIWLAKNASGFTDANNAIPLVKLVDGIQAGQNFVTINAEALISLQEFDTFCLIAITPTDESPRKYIGTVIVDPAEKLILDVKKVQGTDIDFTTSFIDFKVKDFLQEILWRFSLTPYYDVVTNTITYKKLVEILQNPSVDNWTNKFDSVNSETYVYGNYAQENLLTCKYNDENSDYYDGSINISNENLDDSKVIIPSKIYAPEKEVSNVFEKSTNIYKLWNKEVKDNGDVTYKSLDKRFYFLRSDNYIFENTTQLRSEVLSDFENITSAPFESYNRLPFTDIVQDAYTEIKQILNQSKLLNVNLFLNNEDIANVDFSKLKYIEQLGNYYLLNKIVNYTKKGLTKCELIKVDYVSPIVNSFFELIIYEYNTESGCLLWSTTNIYVSINIQSSTDGGNTWIDDIGNYTSPRCGYSILEDTLFRIKNSISDTVISNIFLAIP